jgi:ATP-dependent DNA helicase RecG
MKKLTESEVVELKPSLSQADRIVETVAAMANASGGKIIIGVSNSGRVIGVDIGKDTIEKLTNKITQNTDPSIYPKITVDQKDSRNIIVIEVPESQDHLVLAFGRPYKRVGKSTVKMSKTEYERAILEKHKDAVRFDIQINTKAQFDDIDNDKVIAFIKKARTERGLDIEATLSIKEILTRLKLTQENKLTNSALLLFGRNPQDYFMQAEVKCVRFKGTGVSGTMIDMKDIGGNLIDQLVETEKFTFDHISLTSWIEDGKIERQEKWEYPPKAVREALANALAHRDYRSSSKAQIRIFDDRIEFWNPGRLPEGWTVETLKEKHESKPFNPLIAKAFFWIKYIEEVGTGTNKIIEWCKDWGIAEPDFEYAGSSVVVTIRKSKLTEEYLKTIGINERQRIIISYLKEHKKITRKQTIELLKKSKDTAFRELADLVQKGIIKRLGKGKKVFYVVS